MAMILAFQFRQDKPVAERKGRLPKGEVIIFPGVRYERLPEAGLTHSKATKKTRKTA